MRGCGLEVRMHSIADYVFLGAVMLPPLALAIGFLALISPHALARAERAERVDRATAKAH